MFGIQFAVLGTVGLFTQVRFGERNIYLIVNTIKDSIHARNSNYINKYLTVHLMEYFIGVYIENIIFTKLFNYSGFGKLICGLI